MRVWIRKIVKIIYQEHATKLILYLMMDFQRPNWFPFILEETLISNIQTLKQLRLFLHTIVESLFCWFYQSYSHRSLYLRPFRHLEFSLTYYILIIIPMVLICIQYVTTPIATSCHQRVCCPHFQWKTISLLLNWRGTFLF